MSVTARLEPLVLPTCPSARPRRTLCFSKACLSGLQVYPVPFIDKVLDEPRPVTRQSALLETIYPAGHAPSRRSASTQTRTDK
jgi:hypothetical protein